MNLNNNYDWIKTRPIAHRGITNKQKGIVENTVESCYEAIKLNMPIEIDVRLTNENELILLHDSYVVLENNQKRFFKDLKKEEFKLYKIKNSNCTIPTLREVLQVVDGNVPLLIEAKVEGDFIHSKNIIEEICKEMKEYNGKFAIQSFYPYVGNVCKKIDGNITHGILLPITSKYPSFIKNITNKLMLKCAQYDFISFGVNYLNNDMIKYLKKVNKPLLLWTINDNKWDDAIKALKANVIINKLTK